MTPPLCSYLAPIVADLAAQQPAITRAQGTFAVVICPTRELCLQVADVLTMLVRRFVWLVSFGATDFAFAWNYGVGLASTGCSALA